MAQVSDLNSLCEDIATDIEIETCNSNGSFQGNLVDAPIIGEVTFSHLPLQILPILMQYLDTNSLKDCRLICDTWNKEAVRILPKRTWICFGELTWEKIFGDANFFVNFNNSVLVENFLSCLESSKHSYYLMKSIFCIGINGGPWPKELEVLLERYGKYIETFKGNGIQPYKLSSDKQPFFHKLLTSWCQNLKEISICIDENLNDYACFNAAKITNDLSLERITILHASEIQEPFVDWIIHVINKSPRLKTLYFSSNPNDENLPNLTLFRKFLEFTNVANKLEEFDGEICNADKNQSKNDVVHFFSSLNKLKTLHLQLCTPIESYNFQPKRCSVGTRKSLKSLKLTEIVMMEMDEHRRQGLLNCIEYFPNLDLFRSNLKNLEVENVQEEEVNEKERIFEGLKHPHQNLRKLILLGINYEIVNVKSLEALVKSFPSLQFLHLDFGLISDPNFSNRELSRCFGEESLSIPKFMKTLSKLNELQELRIKYLIQDVSEIEDGLSCVPDYKNLKYLTIIRETLKKHNDDGHLLVADPIPTRPFLKNILLMTKSLNCLCFQDIEYQDHQNILDFVKENSIPLQFTKLSLDDDGEEIENEKHRPSFYK